MTLWTSTAATSNRERPARDPVPKSSPYRVGIGCIIFQYRAMSVTDNHPGYTEGDTDEFQRRTFKPLI